MNVVKPHPWVWIFNNAIEDPQSIIDFYENNFKWDDWYTFGTMLNIHCGSYLFDEFPVKENFVERIYLPNLYGTDEEGLVAKKIIESFYNATQKFFESNPINVANIGFFPFNIAKYHPGGRMNYHVDFQEARYKIPDDKMYVTAVFYLNDNYTGGEISFIEVDKKKEIIWDFSYKPKAGDIVVFSSRSPIHHGVETLEEGNKYIIRTYWRERGVPTKEWEEGIEKYGPDEWIAMKEKEARHIIDTRMKTVNKTLNNKTIAIQYLEDED